MYRYLPTCTVSTNQLHRKWELVLVTGNDVSNAVHRRAHAHQLNFLVNLTPKMIKARSHTIRTSYPIVLEPVTTVVPSPRSSEQ